MKHKHNTGRLQLIEWIAEAEAMGGVGSIHLMIIDKAGHPTGRLLFRRHGRIVEPETAADVPIEKFLEAQQVLLDAAKRKPGDSAFMDGRRIQIPLMSAGISRSILWRRPITSALTLLCSGPVRFTGLPLARNRRSRIRKSRS